MPITIDEFEEFDPVGGGPTNAERVVRFLLEHRNKAFKANEIAEQTGVNENSIQPVLGRLRDRGLVRHKEPYWAIGDIETVRDAFVHSETVSFLEGELGPESRTEWLEAAEGDEGT